ncbi:MAG: hypothetical protein QGD88_12545, partial [Anaerolineae bacterium]|nr:hypothetical protein [Anaerolineae bacterium]
NRLDQNQQNKLLQIIAKRIIINQQGQIIQHDLHSPFSYLIALATEKNSSGGEGNGSGQVQYRPPVYSGNLKIVFFIEGRWHPQGGCYSPQH